jgi:hypothetical protein
MEEDDDDYDNLKGATSSCVLSTAFRLAENLLLCDAACVDNSITANISEKWKQQSTDENKCSS